VIPERRDQAAGRRADAVRAALLPPPLNPNCLAQRVFRLPLFPISVVLFPGAPLPLHVFEARYRQMMAHCLEGDRRFGLLYHDPDRQGPYEVEAGQVGCVAEIMQFDPLPDGRSTVLLRGTERFRLNDGIESEALYYEGLAETYDDEPEDEEALAEHSRTTAELFHQVLQHISDEPQPPPPLDDDEPLSFQIAQWIKIDPMWQQRLLEIRREGGRLDVIDELLRITLDL
jgi:ATP-dependent Lon protease